MLKYYLVGIGMEIHAGKGTVNGDTIELIDPIKFVFTQQGVAFAPSFMIVPVDKAVFKYDYYSEITDQQLIDKINESVVSMRAAAAGIITPNDKADLEKFSRAKKVN